jgi:hypothetical protein
VVACQEWEPATIASGDAAGALDAVAPGMETLAIGVTHATVSCSSPLLVLVSLRGRRRAFGPGDPCGPRIPRGAARLTASQETVAWGHPVSQCLYVRWHRVKSAYGVLLRRMVAGSHP